jgi:DNA-directed RNA polymerase specialized sigma24 family protein
METPTAPMRQLNANLSAQDAEKAELLLDAYGGRLFAYLRFMLADDGAARHVLTGTVVTAIGGASQLTDPGQLAAWLFATARTGYREHLQRAGGHRAPGPGRGDHDRSDHGRDRRASVPEVARRAVIRLAPQTREVFILGAPHNQLSLSEIAAVLDTSLDAAGGLRTQAGLDFVRALALCAEEAGYSELKGAELRVQAEEALAQDAADVPPPLPFGQAPAEEFGPAAGGAPGGATEFGATETLEERAAAAFGDEAVWDRPTGPLRAITGSLRAVSGPFGAVTGPLPAVGRIARGYPRTRRRKQVAAATAGVAVIAGVALGGRMLASGTSDTITLTHGGAPAVMGSSGPAGPAIVLPLTSQAPGQARPDARGASAAEPGSVRGAVSSGPAPQKAPGTGAHPSRGASAPPAPGRTPTVPASSAPTSAPPSSTPSPTASPSAAPTESVSPSPSATSAG